MEKLARFTGRTVVITGGAGNIGSAITRRFAAEGANVVALGRRRERLDALVAELGEERALAVTADVTVGEDLERALTAAAERFDDLRKHFGDAVGLIHGKMPGPEKDAAMEAFALTLSRLSSAERPPVAPTEEIAPVLSLSLKVEVTVADFALTLPPAMEAVCCAPTSA